MGIRLLLALALALPAFAADCPPSTVGYRVLHMSGRTVAVWYPSNGHSVEHPYSSKFSGLVALDGPATTVCGKPVPLVVFSHGDLGCGLQSVFFTEELARHGYVVAAPDHDDALLCHIIPADNPASRRAQANFFKPETWDPATFADRRADIETVIDGLLADKEFQPVIDAQRIGAAGHSLGGYTVVAMAGGWPSWIDPRIRAVLALSPYIVPFQLQKTLGNIHIPLMYQGGTMDVGITPFLKGSKGAYTAANPPAYFVEFKNAAHFAWVNCGDAHTTASCLASRTQAKLIDDYGIAFFDHYLKGLPAPLLEKKDPALAEYEVKAAHSRNAD